MKYTFFYFLPIAVQFLVGFSLLHVVQTDSGAHAPSYPIGTGALSQEIKRQEHEAEHSPSAIAEFKKM
jgi:hypothetical protein